LSANRRRARPDLSVVGVLFSSFASLLCNGSGVEGQKSRSFWRTTSGFSGKIAVWRNDLAIEAGLKASSQILGSAARNSSLLKFSHQESEAR
jgi:hypothetical protein